MSHHGPVGGRGKVGDIIGADDAALVHSIMQGEKTEFTRSTTCTVPAVSVWRFDSCHTFTVLPKTWSRTCFYACGIPQTVEINGERPAPRCSRVPALPALTVFVRGRGDRLLISGLQVQTHSDSAVVWHQVVQRLTQDDVRGALHGLPHDQTLTLERAFFDGFTCAEIADGTGGPVER